MNHRILSAWGMAAMLLAGCSGGGGSSTPSNALGPVPSTNGTSTISFNVDMNKLNQQLHARGAKMVGPNSGSITYGIWTVAAAPAVFATGNLPAATGSSYNGTLTLGSSPCNPTTPGTNGGTYTCNIVVQAGVSYQLQMQMTNTVAAQVVANSSVPASGAAGYVAFGPLNPGTTTAVNVEMLPLYNSLQLIATAAQSTAKSQFYEDSLSAGEAYTLDANALDPAGTIITSYYGAVHAYPTLTLSATSGTSVGLGVPAIPTPGTAPSVQLGNTGLSLTYDATAGTNDGSGNTVLTLGAGGAPANTTYNVHWVYFKNGTTTGNTSTNGVGTVTAVPTFTMPLVAGTFSPTVTLGQTFYFPIGANVYVSDGTSSFIGHVTANDGVSSLTIANDGALIGTPGTTVMGTSTIQNTQIVSLLDTTNPVAPVVTESSTSTTSSTGLDTTFNTSLSTGALGGTTVCNAGDSTITVNGSAFGATGTGTIAGGGPYTSTVNLSIKANASFTSTVCVLTVQSPNSVTAGANLASYVTILFPATAQAVITQRGGRPL